MASRIMPGSLYVIAWIFFTLVLAPRLAPLPVCIAALLGTSAIEFLQLWHPPLLEAVRATLPGRLVLGSTFVWGDFPAYGIGALLGMDGCQQSEITYADQ